MMTAIEVQPTKSYSVEASTLSGSPPENTSAKASAAGPSAVAAYPDGSQAPMAGPADIQQPLAAAMLQQQQTQQYPPTNGQTSAEAYFQQPQPQPQPQPQQQTQQPPPPYAAVVQQQQPIMSASATYPWDRQISPAQGFAASGNATVAATVTSGNTTEWMPKPLVTTLCPPGLEYLVNLNQLAFVDEMVMTPTPADANGTVQPFRLLPRRFSVRNARGQQVYVGETIHGRSQLHFVMGFADSSGQELFTVKIKQNACLTCCTGCCSSYLVDATVECPPGQVAGSIEQKSSGGNLSFVIKNAEGSPVLHLEAPDMCCVCTDANSEQTQPIMYSEFAIFSLDYEHVVGKIEAQAAGFTPFDMRQLTNILMFFPIDLDVNVKATIAGAAAMLHFHLFARVQSNHSRRRAHSHFRTHHVRPSAGVFGNNSSLMPHHAGSLSFRYGHMGHRAGHFHHHVSHSSRTSHSHRTSHSISHSHHRRH